MASKIIETTASKTKGIRHKARVRETLMGVVVGEVSRIFDKKMTLKFGQIKRLS